MKESIGVLLKKAMLEYDKQANQMLVKYDLTHTQHKTLMFLYDSPPKSVRQIDIERFFSMTNPTVTGILKNMERKGLIRRVANPSDKRSKVISLTAKALQMRDELYECSELFDSQVSQSLSEEELSLLVILLKKMLGPAQRERSGLKAKFGDDFSDRIPPLPATGSGAIRLQEPPINGEPYLPGAHPMVWNTIG